MIALNSSSIIVGVDVHKYSHTAVAMDPWGQEKGRLDFSNDNLPVYAEWLLSLGQQKDIVVGLEDANCYGVHIVKELSQRGFYLRYVPAILTERERRHSTQHDKSDYVDAKRVGKVILTKYEQTLPAKENIATRDELRISKAMDLLLGERRDLVKQKTVLKNQIHALLHQYYGDHYADEFDKPFHKNAIAHYIRDLSKIKNKDGSSKFILAQGIIRRINRLNLLEEQIVAITKELTLIGNTSQLVVALVDNLHGCGFVTACTIVAEIVTIRRFVTKDKFAKYCGIAPTYKSSGVRDRLHTNQFGNRTLNRALHTVALSQIACKGDKRGKDYYQKKVAEGKTKLWALRCLKRQLANKVFQILKQTN